MRGQHTVPDVARLLRAMVELFTLDDLREITIDLGADDNMDGDTVVQRAANLVIWAEANEKLPWLRRAIKRKRPDAQVD